MIEEFQKQCNRCLETKFVSSFYRRSGKAAKYGDGLMGHCAACHQRKYYYARRDRVVKTQPIRNKPFVVRVTPSERQDAEEIARRWDCTISDVIRRILYKKAVALGIINDTEDGSIQFTPDYQPSQ